MAEIICICENQSIFHRIDFFATSCYKSINHFLLTYYFVSPFAAGPAAIDCTAVRSPSPYCYAEVVHSRAFCTGAHPSDDDGRLRAAYVHSLWVFQSLRRQMRVCGMSEKYKKKNTTIISQNLLQFPKIAFKLEEKNSE
jgi:hypothetical protein